MMRIKSPFKLFLFSLLVFVITLTIICNTVSLLSCYFACPKVLPDNHQVLRIIFYGSSETSDGSTVSANISILDRSGQEIVKIERSWPDDFLAADFASAEFGDNIYYFPERIYGTNSVLTRRNPFSKKPGTDLVPYYIENGSCLFGTTDIEKRSLYKLGIFSLNPYSVFMGLAKRYTVNLSGCRPGVYYGIFAENGILSLKPE